MPVEPLLGPRLGLTRVQVATPLLDHQAAEPLHHVVVGLAELISGVPGTEEVAPAAQDGIQIRDHVADVPPGTVTAGTVPDFLPEPLHRPLRGPAVQVVADDPPLLPQPPRHAGMKMAAEEVQPLPAFPEINHLRLIRVQLQPQRRQDLADRVQGRPGLCRAAAQHHAVIGVTHQLTQTAPGELSVQDVQVNVGEQRGNHAPNAKGNFCFEATLGYRRVERGR